MIRKTALAIAAALPLALLLPTVPAAAMTPRIVTPPVNGWNPNDPISDPDQLATAFPFILFTVTCGDVTASGWSGDQGLQHLKVWDGVVFTSSAVAAACATSGSQPIVRQGDDTFVAQARGVSSAAGVASILVKGEVFYVDWELVPTPRVGQWVALDARAVDDSPLPMLTRRVTAVGDDTFAVDEPVDSSYIGAPVLDNQGRSLGMVTAAGSEITGSPQYCGEVYTCEDPSRAWWDITAPSNVPNAKATGGRRSVTVTWQPVKSTGGDSDIAYWYRVGKADWKHTDDFKVTIPAKPRSRVTVTIVAFNHAGPGPSTTVSARAK